MFKNTVFAAMLAFGATAATASTMVSVDGKASVYGAGVGGSLAPVEVMLGGDTLFNITASGTTSPSGSTSSNADGLPSSGSTNVTGLNGISGISVDGRQMFLTGVFIDSSDPPTTGSDPAALTYVAGDLSAASFAPALNQSFFIGDGLTGTGAGSLQDFAAPIGADTLLLGFVDAYNFNGTPSYYGDNSGSLNVTVAASAATVPLPAGLGLLISALGILGFARRRHT